MPRTQEWQKTITYGKDEMNLAEFPITRLGAHDTREAIEYYGWTRKNGEPEQQIWVARGAAGIGLPTELGERVLVALMAITAEAGFKKRRVEFSMYKILKIIGHSISTRNYEHVERALKQLAGITITSEGSWMDKGKKRRVRSSQAFHIIDTVWLKYQEDDEQIISDENCNGYIVWGDRIWKSFKDGYIKNLGLREYYSFRTPTARRLYRFLDKRMAYQDEYQIDIFALANNLGMAPAQYAAHLKRKLKKSFAEMVESGFLSEAEFIKVGKYVRARFSKSPPFQLPLIPEPDEQPTEKDPWQEMLRKIGNPGLYQNLQNTKMVNFENGVLTISAGPQAQWMQTRMVRNTLLALNGLFDEEVVEVKFVE